MPDSCTDPGSWTLKIHLAEKCLNSTLAIPATAADCSSNNNTVSFQLDDVKRLWNQNYTYVNVKYVKHLRVTLPTWLFACYSECRSYISNSCKKLLFLLFFYEADNENERGVPTLVIHSFLRHIVFIFVLFFFLQVSKKLAFAVWHVQQFWHMRVSKLVSGIVMIAVFSCVIFNFWIIIFIASEGLVWDKADGNNREMGWMISARCR